jgi:hypothetical protein
MRRVLTFAAVLCFALPFASARAAEPCGTFGGGILVDQDVLHDTTTCSAQHEGLRYAVAASDAWSITVKRGTATVQTLSKARGSDPAGALTNRAGDTIIVTIDGQAAFFALIDPAAPPVS